MKTKIADLRLDHRPEISVSEHSERQLRIDKVEAADCKRAPIHFVGARRSLRERDKRGIEPLCRPHHDLIRDYSPEWHAVVGD